MKINLTYDADGYIRTPPFALLRKSKLLIITQFVVDTGCPYTLLNHEVMTRARISPKSLTKVEGQVAIGGNALQLTELDEEISFKMTANKAGKDEQIELPIKKLLVGMPRKESTHPTPCLLGLDFVVQNKLKFVFDSNTSNAYFERQDN